MPAKFLSVVLAMLICPFAWGEESNMDLEKATFAGGCFWCTESLFEKTKGVKEVVSGYTDGKTPNPTYQQVSSGRTGHAEAVEVTYDPKEVTYTQLVDKFLKNIDPTAQDAQFADHGSQYRTAIYYHNEEQKKIAEEGIQKLKDSGKFDQPIVTQVVAASKFYPAEDYHQGYHKTNAMHYKMYEMGSGRNQYLDRVWGKERKENQ
jgi:methionine-S-sulfoxide reductase